MQVFEVKVRLVINTIEDVSEENIKEVMEEILEDFDYGNAEVVSVEEE